MIYGGYLVNQLKNGYNNNQNQLGNNQGYPSPQHDIHEDEEY